MSWQHQTSCLAVKFTTCGKLVATAESRSARVTHGDLIASLNGVLHFAKVLRDDSKITSVDRSMGPRPVAV